MNDPELSGTGDPVPDQVRDGWRPTPLQIVASACSLGLAAFLVVFVIPRAAGTQWSAALVVLQRLSVADIALMTLLWAVGLGLYTFVYTGSLPGLTHSKGLALNLTGSLVSNLFPFGGAAGVATTYGLTWSWGFSGVRTSLMILVSGLANLLIRLVLPIVGLVALMMSGFQLKGASSDVAIATLGVLALISAALIAMLFSARCASAIGRFGDFAITAIWKLLRKPRPTASLQNAAEELQSTAVVVIRAGWWKIAFGMCAYYGFEIALFGVGIHALGSNLGWASITAAFALSRVLSAVVVTPSGVGIAEAGTASVLVLFGCPPEVAAAAMVILMTFTYLIELPTGVAGWLWVFFMRKRWVTRSFRRAYS